MTGRDLALATVDEIRRELERYLLLPCGGLCHRSQEVEEHVLSIASSLVQGDYPSDLAQLEADFERDRALGLL